MQKFQVSFIGLSTLFGKTSSLLLKQSPFIKCIKLYDEVNIDPALDVAGLNTQCKVKAFLGKEQLRTALKDADIIVIGEDAASENPSATDLFPQTAPKMLDYAKAIASAAPEAIVVVAASPVNIIMPLITQMLVHHGCYNCNKVLGATTVDNIRANSLLASHLNSDARNVVLPVIGGSSEETRVPIFSQAKPNTPLSLEVKEAIIRGIKKGETEIKKKKRCPESLNKAYATSRFINAIMAGLRGESNVTDITLTKTTVVPGVEYFALPVMLGKQGVSQRFGIPRLTGMEQEMVNKAINSMRKDIDKAGIFWRNSTAICFDSEENKASVVEVPSVSNVLNIDTQPKLLYKENPFNSESFEFEKKQFYRKINPLDRLWSKNKEDETENKKIIKNQVNEEKEEDLSVNKEELDLERENVFVFKKRTFPDITIKNDKKKAANVFSNLVKKTEQILTPSANFSAEPKYALGKNKPKHDDDHKILKNNDNTKDDDKSIKKLLYILPKTYETETKIPLKHVQNENFEAKKAKITKKIEKSKCIEIKEEPEKIVSKITEKYKSDDSKEKFKPVHPIHKQDMIIENARREKVQTLKLQRIAEKAEKKVKNKSFVYNRQTNPIKKSFNFPSKVNLGKHTSLSTEEIAAAINSPRAPFTKLQALARKMLKPENVKETPETTTVEVKEKKIVKKTYDLAEIEQPLKAYIADKSQFKTETIEEIKQEEKPTAKKVHKISKEPQKMLKTEGQKLSRIETQKISKQEVQKVSKEPQKLSKLEPQKISKEVQKHKTEPQKISKPEVQKQPKIEGQKISKEVPKVRQESKVDPKRVQLKPVQVANIEKMTKDDSNLSLGTIKSYSNTKTRTCLKEEDKLKFSQKFYKTDLKQKEEKKQSILQMMTAQIQAKEAKLHEIKEVKKEEKPVEIKNEKKLEKKPEKKPFKNLLQMLPSTRKNYVKAKEIKEEIKEEKPEVKQIINIKEEMAKPLVQEVKEVKEVKEIKDIKDIKAKEEPKDLKITEIARTILPKPDETDDKKTPLQLLQNKPEIEKEVNFKHSAGGKLNHSLRLYFKRQSNTQKMGKFSTSASEFLSKKPLLYKLNMNSTKIKPRPKTIIINDTQDRLPFNNISLTRDDKPEKTGIMSLISNSYLKKEDKELSKSFKKVLKDKSRVHVSIPIRDSSKPFYRLKRKKTGKKTLLHMLTNPIKNETKTINIKKVKLPKEGFSIDKVTHIKIPNSLHTGTCADVIKTFKKPVQENPFSINPILQIVNSDQAKTALKDIVSLPNFKLNEYTCKSSFLPNLKFLKEHR